MVFKYISTLALVFCEFGDMLEKDKKLQLYHF